MCKTKIQSLKKCVNKIKSDFLDTIADGLTGTTLLVLFLAIGVFLAFYISLLQVPDSVMELLDVSFSVILVAITAVYVKLTGQIVNQTNKNSEIAFIEKRLEKLYYPLRDVLENPTDMLIDMITTSVPTSRYTLHFAEDKRYIDLNKIDNIIPFQYLASTNIENLLNDFIEIVLAKRIHTDESYATYGVVAEDLKTKVNEDIETYKIELKKIIKYRD